MRIQQVNPIALIACITPLLFGVACHQDDVDVSSTAENFSMVPRA